AASNVDITVGAVTLKKKTHTEKDYGDSLVLWSHSFINYIYIYDRLFGTEHREDWGKHETPRARYSRRGLQSGGFRR
ncbi:hypothetical protein E4U17_002013, partial [Claviceps sp. LM77 group G4]